MPEISFGDCFQENLIEVQKKIKKAIKDEKCAICYIVRQRQPNRELSLDEQESLRQKLSDYCVREGFSVKRAFHNNLVIGLRGEE